MADVVTRLVVESKEYDSRIARAAQGVTQFEKKCRELGGTLEFVEKEDLEFVKALGQMETVSSSAVGSLSELKKAFTELSVQYQNLTDAEKQSPYGQALSGSLDVLKDRIGNLKGQLDSVNADLNGTASAFDSTNESAGQSEANLGIMQKAFEQLSKSIGGVGPVASNMGKMLTGALGPVGIAIAAVVGVFKQLSDAYKRNEEAMSALQQVTAPFKALLDGLQRLFDDLVKADLELYDSLGKTSEGFSALDIVVKPVSAALGVVRGLVAVLSTLFIDMAKGIGILKDKMDAAFQGSKVQSFFQGIKDTVQGFFQSFVGWIEKIANSKFGQKLGLDSLYEQIKGIAHSQDELTKSNQKIAQSELELNKLRRSTETANINNEEKISSLRANAAERDKYSASERVKMLEQAASLEKQNLQRTIALRQKEYDQIKLKNSLTSTGTQDLNAENEALNNITRARIEYNNAMRSMQRQIQGAKNEAAGASGGTSAPVEEQGPAEGSIAWQEKEVSRLTDLWKNATGDGVEQYKTQLDEAKNVLEEMMGKTQEVATNPIEFNSEGISAIKKQLSEALSGATIGGEDYLIATDKIADFTAFENLLKTAIDAGIDPSMFEGKFESLKTGIDISDEDWELFVESINEKLEELDLPPIKLNVDTGAVDQLDQEVTKTIDHVGGAAQAFSALGDAIGQIDDPGAKVAGMIAQAIGSVVAGYGAATAQAATMGPWAWIAFAVTGLATMISTIAGIKQATAGSYASGGIVPGNSFSGDNLTANVNSGELILNRAQQESVASQLQNNSPMGNLQVSGKLSGKDIVFAISNYQREKGVTGGYVQTH